MCQCRDHAFKLLLAACKEFVRKVESGEACSTRSYAQMKEAIAAAEPSYYPPSRFKPENTR